MREYLSSFSRVEFDKIRQNIRRYLRTPMGREHAESLVPFGDPASISAELGATSEMKNLMSGGTPVPVRELPDLRVPLQRAAIVDFVLPAPDLLAIANLAANSRELKSFLGKKGNDHPVITDLVSRLTVDKILEFNIARAIDEQGRVTDGASRELSFIRGSIRRKSENLRARMETILRSLHKKGLTQEELITTRDGRLVIPVRAEVKNQISGFIHSISASGATAFIEPTQTLELNNDLRSLESAEKQEIEKILRELTVQVRGAIPGLLANIGIIGRIDFLHAKAGYSIDIGGNAPVISGRRALNLRSAIHPLLLLKHPRQEIVPLDLEAGGNFNTLIISGPNAGGKSVAMKTVGLLAVMAQSGCHIPASPDSEMYPFSELFVEMGDDQSIENDLSTFSSHLQNLKCILEHATARSLVLIDEIGNGTDPALGSAMGISVLEELSSRDCFTIVTSHHGAFKTCGFENEKMENAGMGFDTETLRPNYKLSVGRPGNSYALEIARNMAFPEAVLKRSFHLAGADSVKLTDYLTKFEERTNQLEQALQETEQARTRAQSTIDLYETKIASVTQELKSLRIKAKQEAGEIVADARRKIERLVKEIRESAGSKDAVREARAGLDAISEKSTIDEERTPHSPLPAVSPGMFVRVAGTSTTGEIIEVIDTHRVVIETLGKRVIVAIDKIENTSEKPVELIRHRDLTGSSEVKTEIDLRGLFGDEAISAVDRFLDASIHAGLKRVRIIHGKGTGALRKKVTEYLKSNSRVVSFQLGEWNEGGSGVTVVILGE
ncbi:MAG TPA: endonuclease MutS2 [Bacteroidota bacterium]|nr:endonuclease MutS2 [Bacteroidota bacterium]